VTVRALPFRGASLAWVGARATLALGILTACGASPTETVEPTLPPRPDVPQGWRTITSDEGQVRLVVPPDLVVFHAAGSVHANRESGDSELIMVAALPPEQLNQPRGELPADWANAGGWLTAAQGHVDLADVTTREVLLPAGPTYELTSRWMLGDLGPRWTVLYVIQTPNGYGLLQVSGAGQPPNPPPRELRLMRELVEFGG
jgi:hypothetical protein